MATVVNQVNVIGTISRARLLPDGSVRARVLVRRTPGMPTNPDGKGFDAVTAIFTHRLPATEMRKLLPAGTVVSISGFLQQRDTKVSLADLLRRANRDKKGDEAVEVDAEVMKLLEQTFVPRPITEIIAESWMIHRKGGNKANGNDKEAEV